MKNKLEISLYGRKKMIKGIIIGTVLGGLIFGGIGATAVTLTAQQVKYTANNSNFTATNAKEALDEIYKIAEYEVPKDTYFYNSETKGEDIVRYRKVDGKYYLCDGNGKVTNEAEQDVSALTLVEYLGTSLSDLSQGKFGFASGKLFLGNGIDEVNKSIKVERIGTFQLGSGSSKTYNIKSLYPDEYQDLSTENFYAIAATGTFCPNLGSYASNWFAYYNPPKISSYDSSNGILTVTGSVVGFSSTAAVTQLTVSVYIIYN